MTKLNLFVEKEKSIIRTLTKPSQGHLISGVLSGMI